MKSPIRIAVAAAGRTHHFIVCRVGSGNGQDRSYPAAQRPLRADRPADRSRRAHVHAAATATTVAGKKIELIVKDDGNVAENTQRLAREMVANDKVGVLAGFGLTPLALAAAPIATQGKTPMVIMAAATGIIPDRSPYIVRTSMVTSQLTVGIADWAPKNGIKRVVTLVSDYAPGIDIETGLHGRFKAAGGEVIEQLRVPLANPDFAPFLQRAADAKPDALFVFVPAGVGSILMKQFQERGLDKSGIKLIGTGDMTDDDILNNMGDVALGVTTSHHYSAVHPSDLNKKFVADFKKANPQHASELHGRRRL